MTEIKYPDEEITKGNPTDTNVNDKSPKFTCYELLQLIRGNGKKKALLFTQIDQFQSEWPEKVSFLPAATKFGAR